MWLAFLSLTPATAAEPGTWIDLTHPFDRLPDTGAFVAALPMKIAGGSGGPLRIVARVPSVVRDAVPGR